MIYKVLHRKLKIEHKEPYHKPGVYSVDVLLLFKRDLITLKQKSIFADQPKKHDAIDDFKSTVVILM